MLRMVLLGLLIPLGIGALAAMELRTPPRTATAVVQPLAETTVDISDSHGALAKADKLEVNYAKTETPAQPALVNEPIPPSPPAEATIVRPSEAPKINRHRHDPKAKKVTTAALPKPKPKSIDIRRTTDIRRTANSERSKAAASEPLHCRLSAFGGLRKALNTAGCEI
ncbi:hypothetical protein JQ609_02165 [Bradyrhizobium sp. AUGA SZCCT0169]|uniref:hypothetical protein n=1 Tax=Bradyrhizobium sp. AUGA SZCCT0169 TaxID=2807663 RepID=UPI001BACB4C2|nr:hypothetical protein [Bradyrhizobium sp. AUGA SZCCT0169]MBR1245729.1 hypothetical protein [Bradyrhizobium sp. AUGA SZCCT0169]